MVVRHAGDEERVGAGEAWPRGCAPPRAAPTTAASPRASLLSPKTATLAPETPAEASEIAAQNRLFAEATAARRRGDARAAVAGYEQFLARYPSSQLAESAMVERMRLLAMNDRPRAREAAAAYLRLYPSGFAGREAAELAAQP